MKRRSSWTMLLVLVSALALLAACQPAAEEGAPVIEADSATGEALGDLLAGIEPPVSYEVVSTSPEPEGEMTLLFQLEEGAPVKVKMILDHGWLVLDMKSNDTYVFEEEWGHIMQLPLAAATEGVWTDPRDYVDTGARVLGEESVGGERCWIIDSSTGPAAAKVWVGSRDGLPRRVESDEGVTRFAYSRFGEVEDSEFELPPQLRVVDLDEMVPGKS